MATSVVSSRHQGAYPRSFECGKKEFHYLDKPRGYVSGMARGNLGHQMHYSVCLLEKQLADEGRPHVLQLNAFGEGEGGWMNPDRWHLYADGLEVAIGSGEFARACFEDSAEAFLNACRRAVEDANLADLDEREFYLLCRARGIARFGPFDDGSCFMGSREGRA